MADADRLAAAWRLSVYGLRAVKCAACAGRTSTWTRATVTVTITRPVINGDGPRLIEVPQQRLSST